MWRRLSIATVLVLLAGCGAAPNTNTNSNETDWPGGKAPFDTPDAGSPLDAVEISDADFPPGADAGFGDAEPPFTDALDSVSTVDVVAPDAGPPSPEPDVISNPWGTGGAGGGTGIQTGACGNRPWIAHIPFGLDPGEPAPVVVATHGYGDTHLNFFQTATLSGWQTAADQHGFIFVVPAHTNATRPSFIHFAGATFDAAATTAELADVMSCLLTGVGALWDLDTQRIHWMGFSEGALAAELVPMLLETPLAGVAPYAGAILSKAFPTSGQPRVYSVCGTQDPSFATIQSAFQEWVVAGHAAQAAWVPGVGHLFSALNLQGPSPGEVFVWLNAGPSEGPGEPPGPPVNPPGDINPPANGSSNGSGGAPQSGAILSTPGGVSYRLIAPTAGGVRPLLIVYSGTEGGAIMTQNMLGVASAVGLSNAVIAILDGVTYNGNGQAGADVLDAVRAAYDIDNDRTWLLSESAGTTAGLQLAFTLRPSYFAAFWANDVNASATPVVSADALGFQPWGNAGPGGAFAHANTIVNGMIAAGYRTAPPTPYDGPGAGIHGSPQQFVAAVQWFAGRSR